MKRSTDRVLTTHTGSLPRPPELLEALVRRDRGEAVDEDALAAQVRAAVADSVRRQTEAGVAVVNDGEVGKIGYATYVTQRLEGFGGEADPPGPPTDMLEFPEYLARVSGDDGGGPAMPACDGPISYRDTAAVRADIDNLRDALDGSDAEEAFLSAASPGVVSFFLADRHHGSHEEYLFAIADAMKTEYDEIHRAGIVLQLDCPDLAFTRERIGAATVEEFRRFVDLHIEAIDHATRDIPPDAMRIHVCWGNYEGPHHHDVPLRDIVDLVLGARPAAVSFEAANPRHGHEWTVFEDVVLPEGKVLVPGVLDTTTNYIEHPELVAQRIDRYARLVGPENVIAGTDCGFASFAASQNVDPAIVWAKLGALAEGARLASKELYGAALP
jgi:5-methyltetrahydropteroyltriglutamate--homocysteine methyltransferase